jgi:hypothetical protein
MRISSDVFPMTLHPYRQIQPDAQHFVPHNSTEHAQTVVSPHVTQHVVGGGRRRAYRREHFGQERQRMRRGSAGLGHLRSIRRNGCRARVGADGGARPHRRPRRQNTVRSGPRGLRQLRIASPNRVGASNRWEASDHQTRNQKPDPPDRWGPYRSHIRPRNPSFMSVGGAYCTTHTRAHLVRHHWWSNLLHPMNRPRLPRNTSAARLPAARQFRTAPGA